VRASEIPTEIVSIGHFLTRAEAARAAGVPSRVLAAMNGLVRLAGRYSIQEVYPAFMFEEHLDAFRDIVARFNGTDPWLILGWLHQGRSELGGRSPAAWICDGHDPAPIGELAAHASG
jgi:hypothetical protein